MKFPILLAQGVEGIAVGLSTKILPHNFIELVKASIQILKGNKVTLYPDFQNGGMIDVADYNAGRRGGKVKVRAKIESPDKKTLLVKELPYGVTTETLIESILKANDKGQIKIKKVIDNTAKDVEINIELQPGISPDVTIDALYAFTDCEISISPNACVIVEERPVFWDVHDLLKFSTLQTRALLGMELDIKKNELQEDWLFASLEKIFIEKRIYRDIEECETWEAVISTIETGLRKYVATPNTSAATAKGKLQLLRELTEEDFTKLTEIKIKRISKFNSFKADEYINSLQDELQKVQHNIDNLTEFTISYFDELLRKYGKGKERRTQILTFDTIQATNVVANNAKLYVNREEGFIGMGLKKDEFVADCSDIDDIIIFRKDGICKVVKIGEKIFVGKDIIHVAVWRKADDRSTYNLLYVDGKTGRAMSKRFNVTAVTRDKEYDLTTGEKGSKVLYFTANPNGEAEIVSIQLSQGCSAKTKVFDFDFGDLAIKGRGSLGNIVTKYPIKKIVQKEVGKSTLGAKKIWYDAITGRLNTDERGKYLGEFDTGDTLLVLSTDGTYYTTDFEMTNRYDMATLLSIEKITPNTVVSAIYYDGNKGWTMVKRFKIETNTLGQKYAYISDHKNSKLLFATTLPEPRVQYNVKLKNQKMSGEINLTEFIDIKGWKALGNKLSDQKLTDVKLYVSK